MCQRRLAAFHPRVSETVPHPASFARDRSALVRTLREACRQHNETLVRSVFANLEVLLLSRDRDLRGWVTEFLEALQDSSEWNPPETDAYLPFMGPSSLRIWSGLSAIRSDLAECSVLEAEVGMWRVVHSGSSVRKISSLLNAQP
ncbi:MAG TPA: hypothetical protein VK466_05435 [Terriglobales bacterium]|nr:hypothetical protein [Terriglobales bacterium]